MSALRNPRTAAAEQRRDYEAERVQQPRTYPQHTDDNLPPPQAANDNEPVQERNRALSVARKKILGKASLKGAVANELPIVRQARAISAGLFILGSIPAFYTPQFTFWVFAAAGLGFEIVPFVNGALPGTEVFTLFYFLVVVCGLLNMLFAVAIFLVRRVDCFSGIKLLVFLGCLTGYAVMVLNLFPFVAIWVLYVMYNQSTEKSEEQEA